MKHDTHLGRDSFERKLFSSAHDSLSWAEPAYGKQVLQSSRRCVMAVLCCLCMRSYLDLWNMERIIFWRGYRCLLYEGVGILIAGFCNQLPREGEVEVVKLRNKFRCRETGSSIAGSSVRKSRTVKIFSFLDEKNICLGGFLRTHKNRVRDVLRIMYLHTILSCLVALHDRCTSNK